MKLDWTNINLDNSFKLRRGMVVKDKDRYLLITSSMDTDGEYYIADIKKDTLETEQNYAYHRDIIGLCYIDTGVFDILLELLEE